MLLKYWRDTYATNVTLDVNRNLYRILDATARTNFMTYFKLPFAGGRDASNAYLISQGSFGYYWSSSPYGSSAPQAARELYVNNSFVGGDSGGSRTLGESVRCFKDEYVAPVISYTLGLHANGGSVEEDTLETNNE